MQNSYEEREALRKQQAIERRDKYLLSVRPMRQGPPGERWGAMMERLARRPA